MAAAPPPGDVVVIGVDADGVVVHASDALETVLGWTPTDLVGRPLVELIPQRFHRRHLDGFERFVETDDLQLVGRPLRLPALTPDGGEVEIELVLSVPSRSDPARVIGVVRTVGRAGVARQVELSSDLHEAMSDNAPLDEILFRCLDRVGPEVGARLGTVWVQDLWFDGLRPVVTWEAEPGTNAGYVEYRGVAETPDERSDAPLDAATLNAATVDPATLDAATPDLSTLAGQVFVGGRSRWIDDLAAVDPELVAAAGLDHPAGSYLALVSGTDTVGVIELIHDAASDLSIAGQELLAVLGSELGRMIAIRIRRDMEDAERRRVQLALESRGVATWSYRFPSGVMIGDDRLASLYGLPPAATGVHFERYASLIVPEDRERTSEVAASAIERRERFEFRYRVRRPDGTLVWLEGAGAPVVDVHGEVREITGVCYDVTAEMDARRTLEEQARLAALSADVGRAFVRDEPLPEKLARTTDAIVEHLDAAFARIWTVDEGTDELELRASSGLYTHLDGAHARIKVGEYKIGRIARGLAPHLTNDVLNDAHVSDPEWARDQGMQSFAGYPLVVGGRCVGVLAMFARKELPPSTMQALAIVADTVAVGIQQSRQAEEVMALYGQSNRHAATLEAALRDRAHVAEVLQASLVPPSLPDVAGFGVHARYRPGIDEVGGDFYDVLLVGGNRWAFMIGDICGRGPEAARLTALARHSLRLAMMLGHRPKRALGTLNQALLLSDNDGRFCTAVCGVISELDDGSALVELGAGGHPAPIVVRADGTVFEVDTHGTLLGVIADAEFEPTEVRLGPGDTLLVYTDGVVEARREGEMFGVDRLLDVVARRAGADAESMVDGVLAAVTEFDESASKDDLAILAIKRAAVPPDTAVSTGEPLIGRV